MQSENYSGRSNRIDEKRRNNRMKKTALILMALALAVILILLSVLAFAEDEEEAEADPHNYAVFTAEDGTVYDLFVITKMNYGEDHKVASVTGHYERIFTNEDGEEGPDIAPDSEKTYPLAEGFTADMLKDVTADFELVKVTDLYQWYIDSYFSDMGYDGGELVFYSDLGDEDTDPVWGFWFVTTKVTLNEQEEIDYMQYIYVPWC